jgi:hypothetical protein
MINAKLGNSWQAQCPFCGCTPLDLRDGIDHMTDIETLKDLHTSPLHVLLRVADGYLKAGIRNLVGVFKYNVALTDDDKDMIEAGYSILSTKSLRIHYGRSVQMLSKYYKAFLSFSYFRY